MEMSTLSSKQLNMNSMLFKPLIVVSVILYEALGMTHNIIELIPCYGSQSETLKFLIISIQMFLSLLLQSGSFSPGESIIMKLPTVPRFTQDVTDLNDCLLSKLHSKSMPGKYFSFAISTILFRVVDFPWPHSPKTKAVILFKTSPRFEIIRS